MNKEIKYIGFYDSINSTHKRNDCISATTKMDYIMSAIVKNDRKVKVISPAWYTDSNAPITRSIKENLSENITLIKAPSFPTNNKLSHFIKLVISSLWLFFYLIKSTKKGEEVIAYHSLALIKPLFLAKKIKRFKLIYEVEEIYSDIINIRRYKRENEINYIRQADKYIFPTELLDREININKKPSVIIYGRYSKNNQEVNKFNDNKIHLVYAGTFDSRKGGAQTAIKCAEFLDSMYHLHLVGFGSNEDKENLFNLIELTQTKTNCQITFEGLMVGDELNNFLSKCDIGLSTQTSKGIYNDTSFPSKILSYIGSNLRVVSIKIRVLEMSKIDDLLYYYDNDSPNEVAKVIKSIDFSKPYLGIERLEALDKQFMKEIESLIE